MGVNKKEKGKSAENILHQKSKSSSETNESYSELIDITKTTDSIAKSKGMNRRAFIHAAYSSALLTISILSDIGGSKSFLKELFDLDADERLLQQVYGIGIGGSAALIPAANHPWKPPPDGMSWYPTEESCCEAFRKRFLKNFKLRTVKDYPQIKSDDSLYLFGSQVANLLTRDLLGEPWQQEPVYFVKTPEWSTQLRWNLHSPFHAPQIERMQFGQLWQTLNHEIADRRGQSFKPNAGTGWMEDDYLLMTVLPRFARGEQRIFIYSGVHAPGTLAAGLLMASPPTTELKRMLQQTNGEPYYQALFKVAVNQNSAGEHQPVSMELVEAETLKVNFRQG